MVLPQRHSELGGGPDNSSWAVASQRCNVRGKLLPRDLKDWYD
jgi:hypothetical protein